MYLIILNFNFLDRDPPVPSIYFIGRNGAPIEVISKVLDAKSLLERVLQVEGIHLNKPVTNQAQANTAPSNQPVATTSTSLSQAASCK